MADMIESTESNNELLDLPIEKLREYAKVLRVVTNKSWTREEYMQAISDKLRTVEVVAQVKAEEEANAPKPGYSRIIIHKDPSPNASQRGIELALNGYIISVPRGVEVDIPTAFEEILRHSTTTFHQKVGGGNKMEEEKFQEVTTTAYPYTVLRKTDGVFQNPNDNRKAKYIQKEKFVKKFGRWPTDAELREAVNRGVLDD